MQAREYRPDSGRFLSADRYESAAADQVLQADPLTQNRYAFAGGNPVNNVELDGHYTAGPTGTGAPWRHRHPARSGGGPSGNGSLDTSYAGPTAPRVTAATTRRTNARALSLAKTHPLAALDAGLSQVGSFGSSPAAAGLKSVPHTAGAGFNIAGDAAGWAADHVTPGPGSVSLTITEHVLHDTGDDLESGNPWRILAVAVSAIPVARVGLGTFKAIPRVAGAAQKLRGLLRGRGVLDAHPTFRPGPFAEGSIPARGPGQRFSGEERDAVDELGWRSGCHSCGARTPGTKSGHFVPDHQPPTGVNFGTLPQDLFPQCLACSREQGLAVARYLRQLRKGAN
jgi:RHS repeat-associated protein